MRVGHNAKGSTVKCIRCEHFILGKLSLSIHFQDHKHGRNNTLCFMMPHLESMNRTIVHYTSRLFFEPNQSSKASLSIRTMILFLSILEHMRRQLDHLVSFPSSTETISQLGIKPPTTPFGLGTFPLSYSNLQSSRTIRIIIFNIAYPKNHRHSKFNLEGKTKNSFS